MNNISSQSPLVSQVDTQMRKGMLVYCVLLLCKDGKVYSSDIIRQLRAAELIVVEGTLYPLLNRLARDKLVAYEWQESEQGPPRKYYWLTSEGLTLLEVLQKTYQRLHDAVAQLERNKMNEITKIHLGRQAFTISVDAHKALQRYVVAIERQIDGKSAEVIKEVELRMAELLAERGVHGDKVVLLEDVEYLKEQLGSPQEFSDPGSVSDATPDMNDRESPKRLFRDTEHGMVAGVAAGIATFFKIDAVWIRLLFVAAVVTGGWGIPLYIVLWLIVPEAKTSSEVLQMQGKPVTIESLKEIVARADVPGATRRARSTAGRFLEGFLKVVLVIIGTAFVAASLAIMLGVGSVAVYMLQHGTIFHETFFPADTPEVWIIILALVVVTVVALFVMFIGVAMIKRKWPLPGWGVAALLGVGLLALAGCIALSADAVPEIIERYEKSDSSQTFKPAVYF